MLHPKTQALARQSVSVGGQVLIFIIHAYRLTLSAFMGRHCRFHPTCSAYALTAIRQHGALKGSALALWRITRCGPWPTRLAAGFATTGFDPVPQVWHTAFVLKPPEKPLKSPPPHV